jgi:hypothetical protein
MMTIGKRNFMDSSNAKRRARQRPWGGRWPGTAPGKKEMRIFAENRGGRASFLLH